MVTESHDCPQIGIYNVEGPLFFGAAYRFDHTMPELGPDQPKLILLRMGKVPLMDTTGEANLAALVKELQAAGGRLMISGIQSQPLELLKKTGLYDRIGAAQFYDHTGEAINDALGSVNPSRCRGCEHAAFRECSALSGLEESSSRSAAFKGRTPAVARKLSGGV